MHPLPSFCPTFLIPCGCALLLSACSVQPQPPAPSVATTTDAVQWQQQLRTATLPAVLLLGEQHNAPVHQQWQQATAHTLIARQQLAAVVLEMADAGHSTQGLARDASDAQAQQALQWNDKGWPWAAYGPTVMTAVRAGVPVLGGNLPRAQMPTVMQQPTWDQHLPDTAWQQQRDAIRTGHCGLLPDSQITPMTRIQLAKDASMARTLQSQLQPGHTVLLIAGSGHVQRSLGIPTWLPAQVTRQIAIAQAGDAPVPAPQDRDVTVRTRAIPTVDHCAQLRQQWQAAPATQTSPAGTAGSAGQQVR